MALARREAAAGAPSRLPQNNDPRCLICVCCQTAREAFFLDCLLGLEKRIVLALPTG